MTSDNTTYVMFFLIILLYSIEIEKLTYLISNEILVNNLTAIKTRLAVFSAICSAYQIIYVACGIFLGSIFQPEPHIEPKLLRLYNNINFKSLP